MLTCWVGGIALQLLIDSGASVNTVSENFYNELKRSNPSRLLNISLSSDKNLVSYAGTSPLSVVATFETDLFIDNLRPHGIETFYVVKGATRSLLGRATAQAYKVLKMGVSVSINAIQEVQTQAVRVSFPFFKIPPIKLSIDQSIQPRRFTYTNIPFAYVKIVRERLIEMEQSDIIEELTPDMNRDFCSALLVVPKGKTDVRLVVDLRGANKSIIREPHTMPTMEAVLAKLHGSVKFSTIDLTSAFSHVRLDEESRHITNFYSGEKFFRFKRLPFGLCNAPDIFQLAMETILKGCQGVIIYLDDMLIFGSTKEEHDRNLSEVLNRLKAHNVKLNSEKCNLNKESCTFLGFNLTPKGYQITKERALAIMSFRRPETHEELRSFLGLMTYVSSFIVNRVDKTETLMNILRSNSFNWTREAEREFNELKTSTLNQIRTLGYYSPADRTELVVDASPVGLGAVLVQFNYADEPRIVACVGKTLSAIERKYPQVQREALGLVWGIIRLRFFLKGITFTVVTDAAANEYIFGSDYRQSKRAIQRADAWALKVLPYSFAVKTIEGKKNIADVLSRLVVKSQENETFLIEDQNEELLIAYNEDIPVTRDDVEIATEKDPILQLVISGLSSGNWSKETEKFRAVQKDLHLVAGILIYRGKMVIPTELQKKILEHVHRGHFGIQSMKRTLRTSVWWPGINAQVDTLVKFCRACQLVSEANKPVPICSRDLPTGPWEILQIDFLKLPGCGTEQFFMVTDTYSRMVWCIEMHRTNTEATKKALWDIFKIWGRCDIIQSDNGPPFNCEKFTSYWKDYGIIHRRVVPYSPFMNGMVERANKGIIKAVKTAKAEGGNWRNALQNYLSTYNNETPHTSTGAVPFELMTGRKFKGFLPSIFNSNRPVYDDEEVREKDAWAKYRSKRYADTKRGAKESDIKPGDWVLVLNKHRENKLDPTFLKENYLVVDRDHQRITIKNNNGTTYSRYISDVKKIFSPEEEEIDKEDESIKQGDTVMLKQKPRKTSNANKCRYKTLFMDDNTAILKNKDGTEITVECDDLVKAPMESWKSLDNNDRETKSDTDEGSSLNIQPNVITGHRPKRNHTIPGKLRDFELYNIFN